MTVFENLAFPLKNRGRTKKEIEPRVIALAQMLGLENNLHVKAQHLTADSKQKISLGRGLIRQSVNAILFDEPLTVIDPQLKWELRSQLKHLHKKFGFTMIYVTHDQTEALTFADEVVVMYEGKIVQVGTPEDLFEKPEHTFVGYFIGSPGMNIVPCTLSTTTARINGHELALGARYDTPGSTNVKLGVRPEHLSLNPPEGQGLPVSIVKVDDIGRYKIVKVALGDTLLNVVMPEMAAMTGDRGALVINSQYINIYVDERRVTGGAL
jgi:glycerol transport system ATP-binding protein